MAVGLKPYPAYRDSGLPWLGEIPKHWELRRLKDYGTLIPGTGFPHSHQGREGEVLPFYKVGDLASSWDNAHVDKAPNSISHDTAIHLRAHVIPKGSIIYAKIGEALFLNRRRITSTPCCIDNNMTAFIPCNDNLATKWSFYWASILDFGSVSNPGAVPFVGERNQATLPLLIPPLSEQASITRYLDRISERVDRYISVKNRLIALLSEKKQAIVNRAITRGLDPNAPMKPTGIHWMPEVPEHWEVTTFGRIGRFFKGNGGNKSDEVPDGVPCVRYGDLYTQYKYMIGRTRSCVTRERASSYMRIAYGDVLFAASGEMIDEIGKSAVNLMKTEARCGGDVLVFRPGRKVVARFMGYASDCPSAMWQKARMGRGFTVMHIYGSQLKGLRIALPSLPEQTAIVEQLDREAAEIDTAISRTRRQIELAHEYRERLINDVVTGKLDVRKARIDAAPSADALEGAGQVPMRRASAGAPAIP